MKVRFPYHDMPPLHVPDENLLGVFRPRRVTQRLSTSDLAQRALGRPIGSSRLSTLVAPGQRVLVLSDDYTRLTPVAQLLPPVLAELREGGVKSDDIRILIASGTHRPMTEEELAQKLGPNVAREYQILQHRWREVDEVVQAGETSSGTPIILSRRVLESDLVVGLGHIVPHRITGFSGGAKIIGPGVTGAPSREKEVHWLAAQVPGRELLGVVENPIRHDVEEMGQKAGLRFIVNVVQDDREKVAAVLAGQPVEAHRRGCLAAREIYGVQLPALADIVVTDSYPADVNYWQAAKAVYASELAVKEGGVIILVTPCPEGVSETHPEVIQHGVQSLAAIRQAVSDGKLKDIIGAAIMALTAWVIKERAIGIMVSPGIKPDDQRQLGFIPAETPQEALDLAFRRIGRKARVAVLHHGAEILPLVAA